jgi:hypothetical protein
MWQTPNGLYIIFSKPVSDLERNRENISGGQGKTVTVCKSAQAANPKPIQSTRMRGRLGNIDI